MKISEILIEANNWSVVPALSNAMNISTEAIDMTTVRMSQLSLELSLVAAPLVFVWGIVNGVKNYRRFIKTNTLSERIFRVFCLFHSITLTAGQIVKPMIASLVVSKGVASAAIFSKMKAILPPLGLAIGSLNVVYSGWMLGRTIRDFTNKKWDVDLNQLPTDFDSNERFQESFNPFNIDLKSIDSNQKLKYILKFGAKWIVCEHITDLVSSILCIIGAGILIASSHYGIVCAGLLISSAGMTLVSIIIKNFLMWKKPFMLPSS